jgi:hypothetical protein
MITEDEMGSACSMHMKSNQENMKEREYWEHLCVDRSIILTWILQKCNGKVWSGFIWFRKGISGGLL